MDEFRRVTAADVSGAVAAAALETVFAQYFLPVEFTEITYAAYADANDLDLSASPIWFDGNEIVAAAVAARRETRGWVGGFGVAPARRGRRIGSALLGDIVGRVRSLGVNRLTLEVLTQNVAARRLYAKGGFRATRLLQTLRGSCGGRNDVPANVPYRDIAGLLDDERAAVPSWQMSTRSLRNAPLYAVGDETAFCVFGYRGEAAQLVRTYAAGERDFARLCASVAGQTGCTQLTVFNEDAGTPTAAAARSSGWNVVHEQHEMVLEL